MAFKKDPQRLVKYLFYILGHRPDEFGLVPDKNGYVKVKELLKAMHEEADWRFFRKSNLDEIFVSVPHPPIELKDNFIRAKDRTQLAKRTSITNPPKILYTSVRRKAYPVVLEKGIAPMGREHVVLSSNHDMAARIGKRLDNQPVLLTVNVEQAMNRGILVLRSGKDLFLARHIPVDCFSGPSPPKEKAEPVKRETLTPKERDKAPGSFFPDLSDNREKKQRTKKQRRKKEIAWKEERRRMKKKTRS